VRFRREVEAAKRVSGAYTASVHGAGPNDSPPWLATEYVAGPSLAEAVMESGRLPVDAVWRLAAGLVEALKAVHACDLVHRDLKPANVLLATNGPRVIDFGISRSMANVGMTRPWPTLPGVTIPGGGPGTPGFMAPEQQFGDKVGPPSDVYALGKIIAYASTGASHVVDGIGATFGGPDVHRQPGLAEIPPELRDLVASCLTLWPQDRPSLDRLMDAVLAGARSYPQASSLSFWPEPLASLVRAKEDGLRRQLAGGERTGPRRPGGWSNGDAVPHPPTQTSHHPGQASYVPTLTSQRPWDDGIHWRRTQDVVPGGNPGAGTGAGPSGPSSRSRPSGPSRPRQVPAITRGLSGGLFAAYRPNVRRDSGSGRRSGGIMDAAAYALEGERLFDERRFTEAADRYRNSIKLDPKNPVVHVDLGRTLFAMQRGMDAEISFLEAIDLDRLLIAAHRNRYLAIDMMTGRMPELTGVREEAEAACEEVIGIEAQDPAALANQGDAYCCLARRQDAVRAYQRALAMDEGNPRLLAKLDYAWKTGR
jgi:serine/threonine protein kinase